MIEAETIIDGRYRVLSRLGSGGMAEVYLAEDQLLGRQVAMKVLFDGDEGAKERFFEQTRIQAGLEHPSIPPIYDLGTDSRGAPYCTMRRLRVVTLANALARGGGRGKNRNNWTCPVFGLSRFRFRRRT